MAGIDWDEWKDRRIFTQQQRDERKQGIRKLVESNLKEVRLSLREFVEINKECDDSMDIIEMMEEALMKIADGQSDPVAIAKEALSKY